MHDDDEIHSTDATYNDWVNSPSARAAAWVERDGYAVGVLLTHCGLVLDHSGTYRRTVYKPNPYGSPHYPNTWERVYTVTCTACILLQFQENSDGRL